MNNIMNKLVVLQAIHHKVTLQNNVLDNVHWPQKDTRTGVSVNAGQVTISESLSKS